MITKNCLIFIKNKFYNFDKHPKMALSKTCVIKFISIFFTLEKLRFNKFKHTHRAFVLILQKKYIS